MKAAVLYGVRDLRIEDVAIPEIQNGEVLVKIKAATTCGTDLKIYQRGYVGGVIKFPTVFGHEWAGEVVEVSNDLNWPYKGMRVRAGNSAPCLRCTMCQRGKYNLCEDMIWLWGSYAEYIKVPARTVLVNMQEIPVHVSYEEASITEPLACVLHGMEEVGITLGDTVTIIGAGPIGLLHVLAARISGAGKIISIDIVEERLKVARELGADETFNPTKENVELKVKQTTRGYGADVVIEAIGLPETWEQALKLVRKGGKVLEFGGCPPGTQIKMETELLHYGEITVRGAFHATPLNFKKALNLIASGTIDVKQLITRKMKLMDIEKAFQILAKAKNEIKIAISP
ncbi:MAG: zinc-binding dehydrogenase [Candidatus Bathyarchaeota archaeon]|jgi:L-iditol 2-dehydrogenase